MSQSLSDFEAKYPHVVKGSTRMATPEEMLTYKYAKHGHVCTIQCVDCGKERMASKQDVWQIKRCEDCQKSQLNKRRAAKQAVKRATQKTVDTVQTVEESV